MQSRNANNRSLTLREDPELLEYRKSQDIARSPFTVWSSQDPVDVALRMILLTSGSAVISTLLEVFAIAGWYPAAIAIGIVKLAIVLLIYYRYKQPFQRAGLLGCVGAGVLVSVDWGRFVEILGGLL